MRSSAASACCARAPATPPDLLVGRPREHAAVAVARIPQPGGGKGEERQRAALAHDLLDHLLDERLVFELVSARERRLHERAAQRARTERAEQREVAQHGRQRLVRWQ